MSHLLVAIDDLVVEYATNGHTVRAVDHFSLRASTGQMIAMRGPSGSGKTTVLSALSGMIGATSGTIAVDGLNVLGLSGKELQQYRCGTIGIIFQGFNLIASLTARENVAAPLLVAGKNRKTALSRADELLNEVGLANRGDHKPTQLSGGQQQRVAVARGLIGNPKALLADEPTANLDRASADSVLALLQDLRNRGRTIIIATHDDRLLNVVDDVVQMRPDDIAPPKLADISLVTNNHRPPIYIGRKVAARPA